MIISHVLQWIEAHFSCESWRLSFLRKYGNMWTWKSDIVSYVQYFLFQYCYGFIGSCQRTKSVQFNYPADVDERDIFIIILLKYFLCNENKRFSCNNWKLWLHQKDCGHKNSGERSYLKFDDAPIPTWLITSNVTGHVPKPSYRSNPP